MIYEVVERALGRELSKEFWHKLLFSFLIAFSVVLACRGVPRDFFGVNLEYWFAGSLLLAIFLIFATNKLLNDRIGAISELPISRLVYLVDDVYRTGRPLLREIISERWYTNLATVLYPVAGLVLLTALVFGTLVALSLFSSEINMRYFVLVLAAVSIYLISVLLKHERFSPLPIIQAKGQSKVLTDLLYRGSVNLTRTSFAGRVLYELANLLFWAPVHIDIPQITSRELLVYSWINGHERYNKRVRDEFPKLFRSNESYIVEQIGGECVGMLFVEDKPHHYTVRSLSDIGDVSPREFAPYLLDPEFDEAKSSVIRYSVLLIRDRATQKPLVQVYIQKLRAAYVDAVPRLATKSHKDREDYYKIGSAKYFSERRVRKAYAFLIHFVGDFGLIEYYLRKVSEFAMPVDSSVVSLSAAPWKQRTDESSDDR